MVFVVQVRKTILTRRKYTMRKERTTILSAGVCLTMFLLCGVASASDKKAESPYAPIAGQCVAVVQVKGMACGMNCPSRVSMALKGVKGVNKVRVNYETKRADILAVAKTCEKKALEQFPKALKEAGYDGKVTEVIKGDKAG
jgi:copper chaperone CopZ